MVPPGPYNIRQTKDYPRVFSLALFRDHDDGPDKSRLTR